VERRGRLIILSLGELDFSMTEKVPGPDSAEIAKWFEALTRNSPIGFTTRDAIRRTTSLRFRTGRTSSLPRPKWTEKDDYEADTKDEFHCL
jgi:hypothetical protein